MAEQDTINYDDPVQRLRDAFAQLLYRGNDKAIPMEDVWRVQGPPQFNRNVVSGEVLDRAETPTDQTTALPQRQFIPDPRYDYPMSMGGRPPEDPAPFHGRGSYIRTKTGKGRN
jgi:hypothetical protein